MSFNCNTTDVTSGAGAAYPFGGPEFISVLLWGSRCSILSFLFSTLLTFFSHC